MCESKIEMSDEDFIEQNLKALQDKKSREERKANGRLVAVIVATLCIFLAIYHAWIRKTAVLAGVLVPASIMILYAGWVVFLAKRDKKKRELFKKHMEEAARKHILEQIEAGLLKHKKDNNGKGGEKTKKSPPRSVTTIKIENCEKLTKEKLALSTSSSIASSTTSSTKKTEKHKKHKHKKDVMSSNCTHHATKDLRSKRPSFRERLFRQNATTNVAALRKPKPPLLRTPAITVTGPPLCRAASAP